jgi:hypothetical protein
MKIEATVESVTDNLETLAVSFWGHPTTAKEGDDATKYKMDIPATVKAKRAFYIGRRVNITIEPV